jgi:GDP-D-mannose 3',5'-epimerase
MGGTSEIEIWGDGEQTRSFMYIDDCVEGVMRITAGDYGEPLNLGSTELVSVNEPVDIDRGHRRRKAPSQLQLGSAPQGVRGRNSDNTRLVREIGWEPPISLREGLERTYRWIYDELSHGRRDVSEAS